jgi:Transposase
VCQHLSVARIAEELAVSWNTANNAVLAEGQRVLIADPARFDGVRVIGVDEYVWRPTGRTMIQALINMLSNDVPKALQEVITLGRTLKKRAADILAYFNRPGTSNGPTEAINGRLEHLRGTALGFRKPHQLHPLIPTRNRRIQTPTTPCIMKSRYQVGKLRPIGRASTQLTGKCLSSSSWLAVTMARFTGKR